MSLPNYKFELKDPRRDKTSIFFLFYFQGQKFKYGTSQIIYPELWDKERQRPTNKKTLITEWSKQVPDIKTDLENISQQIRQHLHKDNRILFTYRESRSKNQSGGLTHNIGPKI
jgi:hypothetical protein